MSRKRINPGEEYGYLTAICDTGKRDSVGNCVWLCRCVCGRSIEKTSRYLHRKETTRSCGCRRGEKRIKHGDTRKHGKTARLYRIWSAMLWRCSEDNDSRYSYAKKGIKVCEEWLDYETFKTWSLENGYSDDLSIDRIDNKGNYEPSNCRWATHTVQANNKSNNHLLNCNGKVVTLAELARESGINYSTLRSRINRQGLSIDKALSKKEGTRDARTGRFVGGYDA